jgi:hypothetical protein
VTADARLAQILTALELVGLTCLVMGGHAVRYYGLDRNTNDFDLDLAPDYWNDLPLKLRQTQLFAGGEPVEGPSWRPGDFRRFQVGTLASGREEWLEFWRENHLLPPFAELYSRREEGPYGGRIVSFLSLPDLIRSKETEREIDGQDSAYLEEFNDARLFGQVSAGKLEKAEALSRLRSRRGFETFFQPGYLTDCSLVRQALAGATLSVTQAYLLPFVPQATDLPTAAVPIEPVVLSRLRTVQPGSNLHLALVEVVRRQYKLFCQAQDKADKEAIRSVR